MDVQYVEVIGTIIMVLVIPYVIQLIKREAISSTAAGWLAIILSIAAGIIAGLISGIPQTPAQWFTFVFAIVGGVQTAYMAFKAIGITNKWLDALLEVGSTKKSEKELTD